jgi:hypothetical protein
MKKLGLHRAAEVVWPLTVVRDALDAVLLERGADPSGAVES